MFKLRRETRNVAVTALTMFCMLVATGPAMSVYNIALKDSTDINPNVGFNVMVVAMAVGIPSSVIFVTIYRALGIKLTYGIGMLLNVPYFVSMIWVYDTWTLYVGAVFSGVGGACIWSATSMATADNSKPKHLQRNMGFFTMGIAFSTIAGGVFNYLYMGNMTTITSVTRKTLFSIFTGIAFIGAAVGYFGMVEDSGTKVGMQPFNEDSSECDDKSEKKGRSLSYYLVWFKKMAKRRAFWIIIFCNLYWAVMCGFYGKILPTAVGAVFSDRKLVFLPSIFAGVAYLVGSIGWPYIMRLTNNTFAMIFISFLLLTGIALAILILPFDAATNLDTTASTYVTPKPYIVIIISLVIGLADSGFTILYYAVVGKVFVEDTAAGYAIVDAGFCTFYVLAMFITPFVSLHVLLFMQIGIVLMTSCAVTLGLRKYLVPETLESLEEEVQSS